MVNWLMLKKAFDHHHYVDSLCAQVWSSLIKTNCYKRGSNERVLVLTSTLCGGGYVLIVLLQYL